MITPPIKIGITGTHSTGKTSFFDAVQEALSPSHLRVVRIGDFARRARSIGFPILRDHTFESTLWMMAECLRLEAEASLSNDVILVDRPVLDALGYLRAALQLTNRTIGQRRLDELTAIAKAHTPDYDLLIKTSLDANILLGEGRDRDPQLREAAASWIEALISDFHAPVLTLTSSNRNEIIQYTTTFISSRVSDSEG